MKATDPKTRTAFWVTKLDANKRRDLEKRKELESLGWRVIEIWECETVDFAALQMNLRKIFGIGQRKSRGS